MPEHKKLRRIIDNLAKERLGKNGIISISYEKIDGKFYIIFGIRSSVMMKPAFDYEAYPKKIDDFEVMLKPVRN